MLTKDGMAFQCGLKLGVLVMADDASYTLLSCALLPSFAPCLFPSPCGSSLPLASSRRWRHFPAAFSRQIPFVISIWEGLPPLRKLSSRWLAIMDTLDRIRA